MKARYRDRADGLLVELTIEVGERKRMLEGFFSGVSSFDLIEYQDDRDAVAKDLRHMRRVLREAMYGTP